MGKYIYGFDIGGTTVKIGLFSLEGVIIKKWEIRTNKREHGKHIIKDVFNSIKNHSIPLSEVIGYGFGVPGPVVNGLIVECVNLGWKNYDLFNEFSKLSGSRSIFIENDANVAALGEAWKGAAVGYNNSALITIGTGVGGGLVVNGSVIEGVHGAAGEIGHIKVIHENGLLCNCGNIGCLETVASATGIKNEFKSLMKSSSLSTRLRGMNEVSVKLIFDSAKENDQLCLAVVDKVSYYLGYACTVLSVITNPNIIVIGGGVSRAGKFFIDKIRKNFDELVFNPAKNAIIAEAKLGNDAGIYGAASLVKNG